MHTADFSLHCTSAHTTDEIFETEWLRVGKETGLFTGAQFS